MSRFDFWPFAGLSETIHHKNLRLESSATVSKNLYSSPEKLRHEIPKTFVCVLHCFIPVPHDIDRK